MVLNSEISTTTVAAQFRLVNGQLQRVETGQGNGSTITQMQFGQFQSTQSYASMMLVSSGVAVPPPNNQGSSLTTAFILQSLNPTGRVQNAVSVLANQDNLTQEESQALIEGLDQLSGGEQKDAMRIALIKNDPKNAMYYATASDADLISQFGHLIADKLPPGQQNGFAYKLLKTVFNSDQLEDIGVYSSDDVELSNLDNLIAKLDAIQTLRGKPLEFTAFRVSRTLQLADRAMGGELSGNTAGGSSQQGGSLMFGSGYTATFSSSQTTAGFGQSTTTTSSSSVHYQNHASLNGIGF